MLCTHTGNDRFYQQQCGIRQHAYSFRRLYCHFLVLSHETNNRVHEWRWKLDYLVVMGYRRMPLPPSDFLINLDEEWREREQTFETIGRFIVVTVFFNGIEYLYKTGCLSRILLMGTIINWNNLKITNCCKRLKNHHTARKSFIESDE